MSLELIIQQAEGKKREADLTFAKSKYEDAISLYEKALETLLPIRFMPFGEKLAIQCLTNQVQCFLKLDLREVALQYIEVALTIPSVSHEIHLQRKLHIRKSSILESLGRYDLALKCLDFAISLEPNSPELDEPRVSLMDYYLHTTSEMDVNIPRPVAVPVDLLERCIATIISSRGNAINCDNLIQSIIDLPGYIDCRNGKNVNAMGAVCFAAIQRAKQGESPDALAPLLELLLTHGSRAEQRYPSEGNKTPLMFMAYSGAVKCARLLMKHGASPRYCDDSGWNALHVACAPDNAKVEGSDKYNDEMVEALLAGGAIVNSITSSGMCPIHFAAQKCDHHSIHQLIHAKANLAVRSHNGFTPIVWALIGSSGDVNCESVQVLLKSTEGTELYDEYVEDMKCYKFSWLLFRLKQFLVKSIQSIEEKSANDIPNYVVHRMLLQEMFRLAGRPMCELKNITYEDHAFLVSWINNHLPKSLYTKWTPSDDPRKALENGTPLDRVRLIIMLTSATGPSNQPQFFRDNQQSVLFCGLYPDYLALIVQPVISQLTTFIPTESLVTIISKYSPLLHQVDNGTEFWVNCLRSSICNIKLISSPEHKVPPLFITELSETGSIDDVPIYSTHTLFVIWPRSSRFSDIFMTFAGQSIVILGYIEQQSEDDNIEARKLLSGYQRIATYPVASWPHIDGSTLTVWSKIN